VPFIRAAGGAEYALIPVDKMEFNPTAAQVQLSQTVLAPVKKFEPYILKHPGSVIVVSAGVDHRPNQTSIKDQGARGTCVCFASMAGLEAKYGGGTLDLSENYANYLYMKAEGHGCKSDGLQTHNSADYLKNHGVCKETVCPYQTSFPSTCNNGASSPTAMRVAADASCPYKIESFQKIWRKDDLATDTGLWINNPRYLMALLDAGYDIVYGTHVAGWTSPYTGVIDVKLGPGGDPLPSVGGHAMLIVGYNSPQEYFIVKNSWGPSRGQSGYLYLSFDYIRTYAKYGYIITAVEPVLTLRRPLLRAVPMTPSRD
jgi:C1A family cysteine protease